MQTEEVVMSDQFVITKEFPDANAFSMFIEERAIREGMTLVDTIIAYCEEKDIDVEVSAKLVTKSLKEKLAVEFEELNMMRREHGVLDL
jgi:hypothetical protein